jgi:hypothetical protein
MDRYLTPLRIRIPPTTPPPAPDRAQRPPERPQPLSEVIVVNDGDHCTVFITPPKRRRGDGGT